MPFQEDNEKLKNQISKIKHKIVVLSGKGGVGKSTIAVNFAYALSQMGKKVGLLDIDIHGPSVPKMLKMENGKANVINDNLAPLQYNSNMSIMSIGFLLQSKDDPVIWRGPLKYNMIKQFIENVEWGEMDYLVIDSPPGTGDEPLSIIQILGEMDGAIIVTTPQQVAISDVRKSINFCNQLKLKILGVIENMSGFVCPHCNKTINIFGNEGGQKMAQEMNVPFLGKIPLEKEFVISGDSGKPYIETFKESKAAKVFKEATKTIVK